MTAITCTCPNGPMPGHYEGCPIAETFGFGLPRPGTQSDTAALDALREAEEALDWIEMAPDDGPHVRAYVDIIRAALRSLVPTEPDPMLGTPADGRHPDHGDCGQKPCPHVPVPTEPNAPCTCHEMGPDRVGPWNCPYHGPTEPDAPEGLRAALERVEWVQQFSNSRAECPWCGAYREDGHRTSCARQAALRSLVPTEPECRCFDANLSPEDHPALDLDATPLGSHMPWCPLRSLVPTEPDDGDHYPGCPEDDTCKCAGKTVKPLVPTEPDAPEGLRQAAQGFIDATEDARIWAVLMDDGTTSVRVFAPDTVLDGMRDARNRLRVALRSLVPTKPEPLIDNRGDLLEALMTDDEWDYDREYTNDLLALLEKWTRFASPVPTEPEEPLDLEVPTHDHDSYMHSHDGPRHIHRFTVPTEPDAPKGLKARYNDSWGLPPGACNCHHGSAKMCPIHTQADLRSLVPTEHPDCGLPCSCYDRGFDAAMEVPTR